MGQYYKSYDAAFPATNPLVLIKSIIASLPMKNRPSKIDIERPTSDWLGRHLRVEIDCILEERRVRLLIVGYSKGVKKDGAGRDIGWGAPITSGKWVIVRTSDQVNGRGTHDAQVKRWALEAGALLKTGYFWNIEPKYWQFPETHCLFDGFDHTKMDLLRVLGVEGSAAADRLIDHPASARQVAEIIGKQIDEG